MEPRNRLVVNRYSVESLWEQSGGWIIVIFVNTRLSGRCSRTSCMDWQHRRLFQRRAVQSRGTPSPWGNHGAC